MNEGIGVVSHKRPQVLGFPDGNHTSAGNQSKTIKDSGDTEFKDSNDTEFKEPKHAEFKQSKSGSKQKSNTEPLPTFLEMVSKEGDDTLLPSGADIYRQTLEWVISTGCEKYVSRQLIEDFAFTRRSYLESEYMNRKLGRVMQGGKQSPYVRITIEYMKQMTALYREIWTIIAQNATKDFDPNKDTGNAFLRLLANRGF